MDFGSMAGELMGALPSWDDVKGAAGGVVDTISGMAGGMGDLGPMAGEMIVGPGGLPGDFVAPSLPDIGPSLGELIGPGGLPGDFVMPDLPDIGPSLGEMIVGPGGLPGDFVMPSLPSIPSIAELMPSIPSLPWDQLGELMAPLPFFGGPGNGGQSGGGGASGSY